MNAIRPGVVEGLGLQELLPGAPANPRITGLTLDSRTVREGWLYAALPGSRAHGAQFAPAAVAAGAAAILTDADGARQLPDVSVPVVVADDLRARLGPVASALFGRPSEALTMFGVTGTNGKTTTVALLEAGLMAAGRSVGTIGTIGFRMDGEAIESARSTVTTPEAFDLHALLATMRERGADSVALEVSSHALEMERVGSIRFDVAAFLNLGHDHLDFHGTQSDYFEAKARLFAPGVADASVVWTDDEHGREIARRVRAHGSSRLITVGTGDADYVLSDARPAGRLGAEATVTRGGGSVRLELALPGFHNMIDGVVALAMLEAVGVGTDDALAGLARAQVAGRMERAVLDDDAPLIIVDFAHTPQAVRGTLESLATLGPLTTVLGCGGDRDQAKRPAMGEAAAALSDLLIVTDDNPRTEDPAASRAAVLEGAGGHRAEVTETADRAEAIAEAIGRTGRDGVVAILGKGHERGQILADRVVDFDDVAVARQQWARLRGGT
ncbi:MAG: UDP-N-acetylmuramoyl-L-alanyl-D-glutamate--2,6-diaminopimelate ligase [Propionibacterium sp.]|nr:UDP-N-acetylmuramoyl-L-alanyl-D-glutamate--2,6-diaminopimelate ligase [Propionibacterium sp.]